MAYNSGYNPDALPPHAEPEQAAQLLSTQQQRKQSNPQQQPPPSPQRQRPYAYSNPQSYDSSRPTYQNKPPPLPQPVQNLHPQHPPRLSPSNSSYNTNITQYNNNDSHNSPPPQNYGFGPPPQKNHGRLTPPSRPPGTPAPGNRNSSADASLFPLFKAVDNSQTGQLTERELGKALVNGDYTNFDGHTVRMMIRMFDVDKSGSINFEEFCGLWAFLASWRSLFDRFDEDKSGSISFDEYTNALVTFGYRLSATFVNFLYTTYDKSGEGRMSFDLFVQSCIILKRMTDVFKRYDDDRDGYITLSFEEFLTEILRQR
ncbi:hypothetical protein OEA41_001014 [Lepraria neglecta]|uniref:EF-hand domain-containing protein n=1 Tax=Lepraria neglecta TaxID=209136 RepID=A0AAD9ZJC8_9LECA|nr:hypothetical protein OEA41_001014 [Lepraria neglecta]